MHLRKKAKHRALLASCAGLATGFVVFAGFVIYAGDNGIRSLNLRAALPFVMIFCLAGAVAGWTYWMIVQLPSKVEDPNVGPRV